MRLDGRWEFFSELGLIFSGFPISPDCYNPFRHRIRMATSVHLPRVNPCFVTHNLALGGAQTAVLRYISALPEWVRERTTLYSQSSDMPLLDAAEKSGFSCGAVTREAPIDPSSWFLSYGDLSGLPQRPTSLVLHSWDDAGWRFINRAYDNLHGMTVAGVSQKGPGPVCGMGTREKSPCCRSNDAAGIAASCRSKGGIRYQRSSCRGLDGSSTGVQRDSFPALPSRRRTPHGDPRMDRCRHGWARIHAAHAGGSSRKSEGPRGKTRRFGSPRSPARF